MREDPAAIQEHPTELQALPRPRAPLRLRSPRAAEALIGTGVATCALVVLLAIIDTHGSVRARISSTLPMMLIGDATIAFGVCGLWKQRAAQRLAREGDIAIGRIIESSTEQGA